jgi:hypothetical protein
VYHVEGTRRYFTLGPKRRWLVACINVWGSSLVHSDSLTIDCENPGLRVPMASGFHLHCLFLALRLNGKIMPRIRPAWKFKTVTALPYGHPWYYRGSGLQSVGGPVSRMGAKPNPVGDFVVVAELHAV